MGGIIALLFATRLMAAAFDSDFSPFPYLKPGGGPGLLAWLLLSVMVVLAVLVWLVLRHDSDSLWLASESGTGGVLVAAADLRRLAASAANRSHPDVVRAEVELWQRGGEVRGRVQVWARPLADTAVVGAAADTAVRRQISRLAGREIARLGVRVKVLNVTQLARHLP